MNGMVAIALVLWGTADPGNLLFNPGYEEAVNGSPVRWELYVMPKAGAEGRLVEETAYEGAHAVMLHITEPYKEDPANNWSQYVPGDYAGLKLRISGYIKAQDATSAALWLQCCQQSPFKTLYVASTMDVAPIYGTRDWTRVTMDAEAPEGTDFLVLRCVLRGRGTAWFDNLQLTQVSPPADLETTKDTQSAAPAVKEPDIKDPAFIEVPVMEPRSFQSAPEAPPSGAALVEQQRGSIDEVAEQVDRLVDQLDAIQKRIDELSRLMRDRSKEDELEAPVAPVPPVQPVVPPLVPHRPRERAGNAP
jgi:hypothetical protein